MNDSERTARAMLIPVRLILLLVVIVVAMGALGSAFLMPRGAHAASADTQLSVSYYSQYQGQPTENYDCGPASVAMVLSYYGEGPGGDASGLTAVRNATGNTSGGDTGFLDLENALSYYGSSYFEISDSLSPAPSAQIQAMEQAAASGQLVIALISAYDFGRSYYGHWVVVTGFSSDGQTVYLNDPDNQNPQPGYPNWIVGGQIAVSLSTFQQAAYDAPTGPYGIVVTS